MALLFLHIPKTAGTTLDSGWLKPRYALADRFCETDLFEHDHLVHRHLFAEMEHISRHFHFEYKDVFRFYAEQGLVPLDRGYYAGHICFGIHQVIANPCRYITLLRHPVARITSYFNLIHSLGHFPGTFRDFLGSGRHEVDNYQVRCLCTNGWNVHRVTQEMLEEAQDNLLRHCVFGVAERMAESLQVIAKALEISPPPGSLYLNKTSESTPIHCGEGKVFRDIITSVSAEDRDAILDLNPLEIQLHAFATKHLFDHWPLRQAG